MELKVAKFSSHEDADKADREYYRSLTPEQRLKILFDLVERELERNGGAGQRLQRVYRITDLATG